MKNIFKSVLMVAGFLIFGFGIYGLLGGESRWLVDDTIFNELTYTMVGLIVMVAVFFCYASGICGKKGVSKPPVVENPPIPEDPPKEEEVPDDPVITPPVEEEKPEFWDKIWRMTRGGMPDVLLKKSLSKEEWIYYVEHKDEFVK